MKSGIILITLLAAQISSAAAITDSANTAASNQLLQRYLADGATVGNASKGEQLWNKKFSGEAPYSERSCATCHSSNLTTAGKHVKTGKTIAALAPSINSDSLNDIKNIEKWFKRNCTWTVGRECSVQEKTDLILFINQQ